MSDRYNGVSNLARFRDEWDKAKAPEASRPDNAVSRDGHINVEGSARCASSIIYSPASPQFWAAIEPGIRPLVRLLVLELDCITYSSCEGHPPTDDGYSMRTRHVGILPRDAAEHGRLLPLLVRAAEGTPPVAGLVRVVVAEDSLASEDGSLPCIDVVFVAESLDWPAYRDAVEGVQRAFVDRVAASR